MNVSVVVFVVVLAVVTDAVVVRVPWVVLVPGTVIGVRAKPSTYDAKRSQA